jgi:hypothetical protein
VVPKINPKINKMKSKVVVTADAAGNVVVPSQNNPEYGYIRVEQTKVIFDDKGFMSKKPISAIINGLVTDLQSLNWKKDQELEGNIVIKEQTTAFSKKQPEADYKVAGKTGIICTIGGLPIYRKTIFTTNSSIEDVTVAHDNVEAIKEKYAQITAAEKGSALKPNTDFAL